MGLQFTTSYMEDARSLLDYYKGLAERALAQTTDEQLLVAIDEESNSIAITIKHMAGNLRSRWTDFLTTDGEKPDRARDTEFLDPAPDRASLMKQWEDGWTCLYRSLDTLTDNDLGRTVMIRGEAHSVLQAIQRALAHIAYHTGQIVYVAKHLQHTNWKPLTVPRGQSEAFNRSVAAGEKSQR